MDGWRCEGGEIASHWQRVHMRTGTANTRLSGPPSSVYGLHVCVRKTGRVFGCSRALRMENRCSYYQLTGVYKEPQEYSR